MIGAILGAGDSKRVCNEWFAEVQARENKEYTIKLESKKDGDTLIEYLDTYMLKG